VALTIEINHAKTRAKAAAASGQPVMPQAVKGRIRRIKWIVLLLTLSIYYVTPFLRWDRGPNAPDQAVLLDFAHGRLYAFFIEIWPQDLYLVTGLLVLASTILILTNALAGRLWCGFACPQTVWTDLFLLVERLIEGDRRQRLKNFGAPLDAKRAMQIVAKHSAWLLISLATGGTLIFYFTDAPELLRSFAHGDVSANALGWIAVFAGTTYGLAGFAREQVCTFMCPWPRLQGAIWDPEAFTVNYRDYRGEQRTSAKKAADLRLQGKPAGDCVDCNQCVTVCPIGIDIREGPNFACINCGLCVDACDGVMSKLGRPRGLIDYESWNNIERADGCDRVFLHDQDQRHAFGPARSRSLGGPALGRIGAQRLHGQALEQVVGRPHLHPLGQWRGCQNGHHRQREPGADRGASRWLRSRPRHAHRNEPPRCRRSVHGARRKRDYDSFRERQVRRTLKRRPLAKAQRKVAPISLRAIKVGDAEICHISQVNSA
jgi:cytochrome c oxidase accessory protein FixG